MAPQCLHPGPFEGSKETGWSEALGGLGSDQAPLHGSPLPLPGPVAIPTLLAVPSPKAGPKLSQTKPGLAEE